jgi:hypothetical protein
VEQTIKKKDKRSNQSKLFTETISKLKAVLSQMWSKKRYSLNCIQGFLDGWKQEQLKVGMQKRWWIAGEKYYSSSS